MPEALSALDARSRAEEARRVALEALDGGDFRGSLAAYDEALGAARLTDDPTFVDWIYSCRAAAAAELGTCDDELVELKRILLRAQDSQTAFRASYTGSRIYELRRDYKKALFYNRIARDHADRAGDQKLRVAARLQAGNLLTVESRFEEAAQAYRSSLADAASDTPPLWQAIDKDNLGYCLLALERIGEGLALVHEAFETLESTGAKEFTVHPLMDLCFGYLKCDRYEEARYFGEAALERVALTNDVTVEKNLLYLVGEACHLSGDTEAAQLHFDKLAAYYPEFRNLRAYLDVFDFRNVINLRS